MLVVLHGAKVGLEGRCYENHSTFISLVPRSSIICSSVAHLLSPSSKNKKSPLWKSSYIFLYFRKWKFLALIIKKFLYFLIFWETETLKKIPISGSANPNKLLLFQEMKLFSPSSKNKKIHSEKVSNTLILKSFLYFLKRKLFLYFRERKPHKISQIVSKESFRYISGNRNPEKMLYISGGTSQSPKTKISPKKSYGLFFLKPL